MPGLSTLDARLFYSKVLVDAKIQMIEKPNHLLAFLMSFIYIEQTDCFGYLMTYMSWSRRPFVFVKL